VSDHADEFSEFFRDVWGVAPFAWQVRLVDEVLSAGRWPAVIDLPTGVGKTAALDVAVYTLSVLPDALPRRIAFVVDRRLIVDQTAARARRLASALFDGGSAAIERVATRLRALASSGVPLDVDRLRGGTGSADALPANWLRWPDQPAVIVSTVDQFGSRLLFRGYGVSKGMRPVHAGLAGNDCLVLLDEVQLSTALAETLTDLAELDVVRCLPRRWQVVQVSATPVGSTSPRFELDAYDLEPGSDVAVRVQAPKRARLVHVGGARQAADCAMAEHAVGLVTQLKVDHGVVGFVVNRVASARAVGKALKAKWPSDEVIVLTGRMRGHEKVSAGAAAVRAANPDEPTVGRRTFVVATQCIEVGADLNFDAMVTEVAPLASLRQRFGRLDRRGLLAASGRPARAIIVGVESSVAAPLDPVYGTALRATWMALGERFDHSEFDVGSLSADLQGLPSSVDVLPVVPQVLLPAHLDLLSFTNPEPQRSPDVSRFLHGFVEADSDVSVLWRSDLEGATLADVQRILELLPVSGGELINVPISGVRRWLSGSAPAPVADVDVVDGGSGEADVVVKAWRWRDGVVTAAEPRSLRPGDVIVAPCSAGGLVAGVWAPESTEYILDVLEVAALDEDRLVLRCTGEGDTDDQLVDLRQRFGRALTEAGLLDSDINRLRSTTPVEYRPGKWAWVAYRRRSSSTFDGADRSNSFIGTVVPLQNHLQGVGEMAADIGRRCGLTSVLVNDLRLAGELHDLGKLDPRFQVWLNGSEVAAAMADLPLAKSRGAFRPGWRGGYPSGARHEFLSAELIASSSELLAEAADPDLVMHLVTTHHGFSRPLAVIAHDPEVIDVYADARGKELTATTAYSGAVIGAKSLERFTSVVQRYGWHGVAWLEAMLRLADHRRSELEANR